MSFASTPLQSALSLAATLGPFGLAFPAETLAEQHLSCASVKGRPFVTGLSVHRASAPLGTRDAYEFKLRCGVASTEWSELGPSLLAWSSSTVADESCPRPQSVSGLIVTRSRADAPAWRSWLGGGHDYYNFGLLCGDGHSSVEVLEQQGTPEEALANWPHFVAGPDLAASPARRASRCRCASGSAPPTPSSPASASRVDTSPPAPTTSSSSASTALRSQTATSLAAARAAAAWRAVPARAVPAVSAAARLAAPPPTPRRAVPPPPAREAWVWRGGAALPGRGAARWLAGGREAGRGEGRRPTRRPRRLLLRGACPPLARGRRAARAAELAPSRCRPRPAGALLA